MGVVNNIPGLGGVDLANLKGSQIVEGARFVTGALPGVGQVADTALAGVAGEMSAKEDRAKYEAEFGDVKRLARHNAKFKDKLKSLKRRWSGRMAEATVSAGGALAGAYALTSLLAGPPGWIVGGAGLIAGGFAGSKLYNVISPPPYQDGVAIVEQIAQAHKRGEEIPPETVFAALAATMPNAVGKKIEKELKKKTGTKAFDEALAEPRNLPKLKKMMQDFDLDVQAYTQFPGSLNQTVSEYFAENLNNGAMDAADLLDPVSYALNHPPASAMQPAAAPSLPIVPPAVPGMHQAAHSREI